MTPRPVSSFGGRAVLPYPWEVRREGLLLWDPDAGQRTVTNAADDLIRWFSVRGMLLDPVSGATRRVFYRDTDGDWGELLHKEGRFAGFAPAETPENPEPSE